MGRDVAFVSFMCSSYSLPNVARFQRHGSVWFLVAASPQRPGTEVGAGVDVGIRGAFSPSASYSGCPRCAADSFSLCYKCGRMACQDRSWEIFTCPRCGNSGPMSGFMTSLNVVQA